VKLAAADFTANDNSTVVLTSGASAGDILAVVARTQTTDGSAGFATTTEVQGTHTTGSITSGAAALTVASATGIFTGDYVVGEGITPGTTVTAGGGTTSLTLSANAGATLSSDPVSFYKADKVLSPGLVGSQLCRAWVNFNGTNNVIRASFNVQSLTDNGGSGRYTINFINDMPDNKYAVAVAAQRNYVTGGDTDILTANIDMSTSNDRLAASSVSVACAHHSISSLTDPIVMTVAVFR
jgi:hypothetical protein